MTDVRINIREAVANHLTAHLSGRTREAVIEHFAKKEADKQANAMISAINQLSTLQHELNRIRPQHTAFDVDGNPVGEPTYTKEQVESRKKLRDQIDKLERALNKADDNGDFGDLYNLTK